MANIIEMNNLRRRHTAKQAIKKIFTGIGILLIAILLCGLSRSNIKVVGYDYDTCVDLQDLAERHCPNYVKREDFMDAVIELNCMSSYTTDRKRLYQYPIYKE